MTNAFETFMLGVLTGGAIFCAVILLDARYPWVYERFRAKVLGSRR
jgi:hypothetical protein